MVATKAIGTQSSKGLERIKPRDGGGPPARRRDAANSGADTLARRAAKDKTSITREPRNATPQDYGRGPRADPLTRQCIILTPSGIERAACCRAPRRWPSKRAHLMRVYRYQSGRTVTNRTLNRTCYAADA